MKANHACFLTYWDGVFHGPVFWDLGLVRMRQASLVGISVHVWIV